ncbi:RES family NAD+ phosphorylase [Falsiroseomonas sp. HW251]|uniref:RES family NAD+ phosphorylase n=1 Tax=Falsiroseomonas sp. HW251 TaxID=3390998 RepID=UPI003D321227
MDLTAWQICREHQVSLTGEQAHDGERWNAPGRRVVYLAEHPALAVLEMRVHLDKPYDEVVHDHVLVRVALPEDVEDLPDIPVDPCAAGEAWLRAARRAVLRVPSIVVREGRNLLLNPAHPRAKEARIEACTPFRFDRRLWGGGG